MPSKSDPRAEENPAVNDIDADTCVSLYKMSRLIRRTEEILLEEYVQKQEMRCPVHFCVGQEAGPAALSLLIHPQDFIVSHYRSHGYYLAKGAPLDAMIAEFYGKASGANGGLAGSMELAHHESHFYSGAIVGGPLGIAMGIGFALLYKSENAIAVSVIGDGSLDEGVSYEALNLAALHKVPLLVLCENNLYAAHTPAAKRTLSRSLTERVRPFGLRTATLSGIDICRLYTNLRASIHELRAGESGPIFVEIETYRYCAHVGGESDEWLDYRPAEEIAAWRARDPIVLARSDAMLRGTSDAALCLIEQDIEAEIAAAIEAAKQADSPKPSWASVQVWSNTYSSVVKEFTSGRFAEFESGQAEARLKPY